MSARGPMKTHVLVRGKRLISDDVALFRNRRQLSFRGKRPLGQVSDALDGARQPGELLSIEAVGRNDPRQQRVEFGHLERRKFVARQLLQSPTSGSRFQMEVVNRPQCTLDESGVQRGRGWSRSTPSAILGVALGCHGRCGRSGRGGCRAVASAARCLDDEPVARLDAELDAARARFATSV